jgi:uncharacterized integral membrane protein
MSLEDVDPEFLFLVVLLLAFLFGALIGATLTIVAHVISARRDRRRTRQEQLE